MTRPSLLALAAPIATLFAVTGCATPVYVSPVEVTRFTAPATARLGEGTITLAPAPGTEDSLEFTPYREAVRAQLEQLGYRVVANGGTQVALIGVQQTGVQQAGDTRGPVSVGGGVGVGNTGPRLGGGLGVGIDLTPRPADRIGTLLTVAIRSAEVTTNLWEGRAGMTVSVNSDFSDAGPAAARLADALFEGFPGQSGETIIVE